MERPADDALLQRAYALARRCEGRTSPRPAVGVVVVREGEVIAEEDSGRSGDPIADALGATHTTRGGFELFASMGWCGERGVAGEALRAREVRRIVVGDEDPAARGWLGEVRAMGIEVRVAGARSGNGDSGAPGTPPTTRLNAGYQKICATGLPHVTLSLSATLDGKIATCTGASRWISGEASRRMTHELRNRLDAVVVGSGTALADDPELTCRIPGGRDPVRVIIDGRFRTPLGVRALQPAAPRTVVLTSTDDPGKRAELNARGHDVVVLPARAGSRIAWGEGLRALAERGVHSVLVEGGAETATTLLQDRAVDRLILFHSPVLFGGGAKSMLGDLGVRGVEDALTLAVEDVARVGDDVMVIARPRWPLNRPAGSSS